AKTTRPGPEAHLIWRQPEITLAQVESPHALASISSSARWKWCLALMKTTLSWNHSEALQAGDRVSRWKVLARGMQGVAHTDVCLPCQCLVSSIRGIWLWTGVSGGSKQNSSLTKRLTEALRFFIVLQSLLALPLHC